VGRLRINGEGASWANLPRGGGGGGDSAQGHKEMENQIECKSNLTFERFLLTK
jgi:hypothetical protein